MGSKFQTHLRPKQTVLTRGKVLLVTAGFLSFIVIGLIVYIQFTQYEYAEGKTNNQQALELPAIEVPKMKVEKSFVEKFPVTIASFYAQVNPISVELRWKCASELNNDHFVLERSINGSLFNEIGQVKSTGSTEKSSKYSFVDKNPSRGAILYRLKQISVDGSSSFVAIEKAFNNNNSIDKPLYIETIEPKNFKNYFSINYFSNEDGGIAVEIINKEGINIFKAYTVAKRGYNTCRLIDASLLSNEEYSLRISSPNAAYVSKIKREV